MKSKIVKVLRRHNVCKASIFGSYATGENKKTSDVDILIQPPRGIGYGFVGIQIELEEALGKKVDLVTYNSLNPYLKKGILREEVRIL